MSRYILFRNQKYAETLANIIGAKVCDDEGKLRGINLQDGDIIIVDAHYAGNMYDLNGIQIVKELQKYESTGKNIKFKILSWFPSEWFSEKSKLQFHKEQLYSQHNVEFIQLSVSDVKLLP
jgi:hypothetical protein